VSKGFSPKSSAPQEGHSREIPLQTLRLLDTGHLPAAANMALDKIILEEVDARTSIPTLRFLQFRPAAALVGYHQDVDLEIRKDYCDRIGIDINRRLTGGGSILFQESALGWELFGRLDEEPFRGSYATILQRICDAAADGLSRLGISARFRPRNDIEVHGRKISGTGGAALSRGAMFQGTVLIENEVELFLKALRVPVEKLKKREIESLMERICFLSDLIQPLPSLDAIKNHLVAQFAERFHVDIVPGSLTDAEERRLEEELPYFQSSQWIMSRSRPRWEGDPIRAIMQTEAGTMRVHLWLGPGGRHIRQALISGDFFAIPGRLVHDLEAALVGVPAQAERIRDAVISFLDRYDGEVMGISARKIADTAANAVERLLLLDKTFSLPEVNELFLVNLTPEEVSLHKPKWLLLPYCSKSLACRYRSVPGCDQCGLCEVGDCSDMGRQFDLTPLTVQSFEHLMTILRETCASGDGMYIGSCCEAFYAKHQTEMEQVPARGILVNLDSTTCYDLGKGSDAYQGRFDNQTSLNLNLIEKTIRYLHGYHSAV
jgi:lipoate---protein ligase